VSRLARLERRLRPVTNYYDKLTDEELRAEYERAFADDQRVAALRAAMPKRNFGAD
jgi:hypothetical protein